MASFSSFENLDTPPEHRATEQPTQASNTPKLLLCLPSLPAETLQGMLASLAFFFTPAEILVASPDFSQEQALAPLPFPMVSFDGPGAQQNWVLTAGDYLAAAAHAEQHDVASVLLLGSDAAALPPSAIRQIADLLSSGIDLTVPSYSLGPHDGLVNSALLYPMTRALFTTNIRFPLSADAGMSRRMAARLASVVRRQPALSQPNALLWPVGEAAVAAFSIRQVDSGRRSLHAPDGSDFNALFTEVVGSLFADIEAKATFWQRARTPSAATRTEIPSISSNAAAVGEELSSMVDAFRLAHNNLQDIWSLILPPQSLLALKKLSLSDPAAFSMASGLWARIVYDFALAFHLRTLNRGHLLGALTPLYLAWVASTLRFVQDDTSSSTHLEETASAFEREKPYLLARWRWPDRFNP